MDDSRQPLFKSEMVSVAYEKAGGKPVHPIRLFIGIDSNLSSPGRLDNGEANLRAMVGVSRI